MTVTAQGRREGRPDKRVWAQDVAVSVDVLRCRLDAREAALGERVLPEQRALLAGVRGLLDKAELATRSQAPRPSKLGNWWRGTLIEAAYQNLHAAEAEIVRLYDPAEVSAEIPDAVARVEASLHRDDPRRRAARQLATLPASDRPTALRKAIEVGTAAGDRQHTRVRSFRNVVLVTTVLLLLFVAAVVLLAGASPRSLSLCSTPTGRPPACPAGGTAATSADAAVVALLGGLGGVLAAAVHIRDLRGTSTPYDLPVALSLLKVPAGALTALAALFAIRGQFVPGLSDLDTQEQILAYALVLGYGQQLLTRPIDRQAGSVLDSVVSKDASVDRPDLGGWTPLGGSGVLFSQHVHAGPESRHPHTRQVPPQTVREAAAGDRPATDPSGADAGPPRPEPAEPGELTASTASLDGSSTR